MSTGTRIAQLRAERQWSQTALAQKVGINVKSVKDWESDVSIPAAASIKKLCFLFHTTSDYLLEIDDRPVVTLDRLSEREAIRARKLSTRPQITRIKIQCAYGYYCGAFVDLYLLRHEKWHITLSSKDKPVPVCGMAEKL